MKKIVEILERSEETFADLAEAMRHFKMAKVEQSAHPFERDDEAIEGHRQQAQDALEAALNGEGSFAQFMLVDAPDGTIYRIEINVQTGDEDDIDDFSDAADEF